jgi:hypothetical protein
MVRQTVRGGNKGRVGGPDINCDRRDDVMFHTRSELSKSSNVCNA